MEFLVFGGPWAGLAAVRTCHGKDRSCLIIRRLGPVRRWRDGCEQVLREGKLLETEAPHFENGSCSSNNEQRRKCSLAVLLSGSPPSPFKTKIVHKTSFYTSATSQDDFEYWTHLWQINACVCAHVSFVCVHMCECEYAYVCLCVESTHVCMY